MSNGLPGPHHCISTARAALEVAFRGLRAECTARGGKLSLEELESFYSRLIHSFSSGFDLFELRHRHCMDASLGVATGPFTRAKILSTFLRAYGEKSACAAFSLQVELLGMEWIDQFFGGLAHYVRLRMHTDIDARLIHAYVDAATTMQASTLTVDKLLKQEAVQHLLLECITTTFEMHGGPESNANDVCDCVNEFIAGQRGIGEPNVCKVTNDQMRRFLTLLHDISGSRLMRCTQSRLSPKPGISVV